MSDFRSRLNRLKSAANQTPESNPPAQTTGASRFGGGGGGNRFSGGGDQGSNALSRFQRRSQELLDNNYDDRDKRSKAGSLGKNIYNEEHLKEFGIEQYKIQPGDALFDIVPLTFEPNIPFFREICVHFGVGFAGDKFICPYRFHGQPCYRCSVQQKMYREHGTVTDEIKALYPGDRAVYLLYNRTNEYLHNKPPLDHFEIWDVPKIKVHGEIMGRARNKVTQKTRDISDLTPGGQGATVTCTISLDGRYPQYSSFDLMDRQKPVPNHMIDLLADIIDSLIEKGYENNPYDYFLHIPTSDEIQESMETEMELKAAQDGADYTGQSATNPGSAASRFGGGQQQAPPPQDEIDPREVVQHFENLQAQLKNMNAIQWRNWLKTDGQEYANVVEGMDRNEAIDGIVADMFDQECIKLGIDPSTI